MSTANTTKVKSRFVDVDIEGDAAVIGAALAPVLQALFGVPTQAASPAISSDSERPPSPTAGELPEPIARRARATAPAPSANGAAPRLSARSGRGGAKPLLDAVYEYLLANPDQEPRTIGDALGRPRSSVYAVLVKLKERGLAVADNGRWTALERAAAGN